LGQLSVPSIYVRSRRSAVKAKTQAINQLRALLVTAPESIRTTLWKLKPEQCVARCARLQSLGETPLLKALTSTLRMLARRWMSLAKELRQLDTALDELTKRAGRRLLTRFVVGPQTAATLLVTAGHNPDRLRSQAALAALCGVSPLEASSGKTTRHRLNRGAIAPPTTRCGRSQWYQCGATHARAPALLAAPPKVCQRRKSSDA
jgi:transposase